MNPLDGLQQALFHIHTYSQSPYCIPTCTHTHNLHTAFPHTHILTISILHSQSPYCIPTYTHTHNLHTAFPHAVHSLQTRQLYFVTESALYELFRYAVTYSDELQDALNEEGLSVMATKLEQLQRSIKV